jgi:hypothetical protein
MQVEAEMHGTRAPPFVVSVRAGCVFSVAMTNGRAGVVVPGALICLYEARRSGSSLADGDRTTIHCKDIHEKDP